MGSLSGFGPGVRRQPLQRGPKVWITDAIGRRLNGRRRIIGQIHGMTGRTLLNGRWLNLEQNSREAGEFIEHLQLPLQAFLLVAQASGPMPISDDQQQAAFTPGRHVAMLASGGLQLAFQQALQMTQALSVAENGFERLGFAKENGGCSGRKRAKCHDQTPEVTEPPW